MQQFIPQYTATTALSPGMQKLFDTTLGNSQTSAVPPKTRMHPHRRQNRGNGLGRPRGAMTEVKKQLRDVCRELAPFAMEALLKLCASGEPDAVKLQAVGIRNALDTDSCAY